MGHVQHAQNNRLLRPEVSRDTSGETGAGEGSDRHQAKVRHDSMATGDSLSAPATDCVKFLSDVLSHWEIAHTGSQSLVKRLDFPSDIKRYPHTGVHKLLTADGTLGTRP